MPLRIALVTAAAARILDDDLAPLVAALQQLNVAVDVVDWDAADVDWASFDVVLLRSTWDYTERLHEFLIWVDFVATRTTLLNPPAVIRWSCDKHYLDDLQRGGIAIVPSMFVEPGQSAAAAFAQCRDRFPASPDIVVKPCVGAGSRDARRHARDSRDEAVTHIQHLLDQQRSVLLQPYLDAVDVHGETALLYFDGRFSHAIRKGPLLRLGDAATSALFAAEQIEAREPEDDELALAQRVLASLAGDLPLLYARVDLIRDEFGKPRVLELELVEPSLFFQQSPDSASRFANLLTQRAQLARDIQRG